MGPTSLSGLWGSRLARTIVLTGALVGLWGCARAGTLASNEPSSSVGPGVILDGFPLGQALQCSAVADCNHEFALADAALSGGTSSQASVVSRTLYAEDLSLLAPAASGALRARSGTLHVVVYALADGTNRAVGVYCGPAGCYGLATYPPVQP
jgi:hypothetical protein